MLQLRPYQRQSVDALWTYFANFNGNPIVVLPTGCGKSLVLSQFCREAIEGFPSTRIVVATHVKELVSQDYLEFIELWPETKAGIYSAGLNRRDTRDQVLFVGIQSVYNKARGRRAGAEAGTAQEGGVKTEAHQPQRHTRTGPRPSNLSWQCQCGCGWGRPKPAGGGSGG